VQKSSFIVTIQSVRLATSLLAAQNVGAEPKVLLKEIRFTGDLGLPISELRERTAYLSGHRMERAKIMKDASSAVTPTMYGCAGTEVVE
jgi:hypothetical protein